MTIISYFHVTQFLIYYSVLFVDKQKIENETKVQTQKESTIKVLEKQHDLCLAKVIGV